MIKEVQIRIDTKAIVQIKDVDYPKWGAKDKAGSIFVVKTMDVQQAVLDDIFGTEETEGIGFKISDSLISGCYYVDDIDNPTVINKQV